MFITIEQNDLFKILTIVSVVGIPPTGSDGPAASLRPLASEFGGVRIPPVEEVAAAAGTVSYELLCALALVTLVTALLVGLALAGSDGVDACRSRLDRQGDDIDGGLRDCAHDTAAEQGQDEQKCAFHV